MPSYGPNMQETACAVYLQQVFKLDGFLASILKQCLDYPASQNTEVNRGAYSSRARGVAYLHYN